MNLKILKFPALLCFMEPFVFLVFSLCRSNFLSNLRPIPVMRPIMVLVVFPLFCRHFGCLWVLPKLSVLFDTLCALSTLQNHYVLKEKAEIWREKYHKTWEIEQKNKWFFFSRMHIPIYSYFPAFFVLCEPTQPKKIPRFSMCIFGTWVAQQVDSDLRPANGERVLCNSSAINFPNIFLCNRLRGMSLHISEN